MIVIAAVGLAAFAQTTIQRGIFRIACCFAKTVAQYKRNHASVSPELDITAAPALHRETHRGNRQDNRSFAQNHFHLFSSPHLASTCGLSRSFLFAVFIHYPRHVDNKRRKPMMKARMLWLLLLLLHLLLRIQLLASSHLCNSWRSPWRQRASEVLDGFHTTAKGKKNRERKKQK